MKYLLWCTLAWSVACGQLAHAVLVSHYTFDIPDISGNTALDVVGSNDAAPTGANGGLGVTTGHSGAFGESFFFGGGDAIPSNVAGLESIIAAPAGTAPFGASERTIAVWFNQTGNNSRNKIFGYGSEDADNDATTGESFDVGLEGGGVRIRTFAGQITYGTGINTLNSGWQHLAVRVNSGATTFADVDYFLNGVLLAPQDVADEDLTDTIAIPDSQFGIGGTTVLGGSNFSSFIGFLDDFRIYDNALTNGEISTLATTPLSPGLEVTVNRDTGSVNVTRNGSTLDIVGYRILSDVGALDETAWSSVSDNYDASGNGSIDSDDEWLELPAGANGTSLSESQIVAQGGDGGQLANAQTLDLSQSGGLWVKNPNEDVQFELLLASGDVVNGSVLFEGNGGQSFAQGDLDFDGDVDSGDYAILRNNLFSTFASSGASNYSLGDLDMDGDIDRNDWSSFKDIYVGANGLPAFQAMLAASVPEPSSGMLMGLMMIGTMIYNRRTGEKLMKKNLNRHAVLPLLLLGVFLAVGTRAEAVLVAHYTFDDVNVSGKTALDVAGSNDAAPTGTNGGTGITTSQPGAFGEAFAFAGGDGAPGAGGLANVESFLAVPASVVPFGAAERTFSLWFNQTGNNNRNKLFGYGAGNTDGNGGTGESFDVGLEAGGIRNRNFNGNITYGTGFNLLNDGWHHLAVRVNSGASTFGDVDYFLDGVLLAPQDASDPDLNDTLAIPDSQFGIAGTSVVGGINNSGFVGLLDEFRIYDNALTNAEIQALASPPTLELTLQVNTTTGAVSILNSSDSDFDVDYYDISSADSEDDGGSLIVANWNSLQDQDLPGFPAGDGSGNGWEEGGGANDKLLGEGILGAIGVAGDYNQDDSVDAADYTVWRDSLGDNVAAGTGADGSGNGVIDQDDYNIWSNNYGATSGSGQSFSTFASGMTPIDLGQIFNTSDSQDLTFTYQLAGGDFVEGNVEYVSSSTAFAATVPEPNSTILILIGLSSLGLLSLRNPRFAKSVVPAIAVVGVVTSASLVEASTNDRVYRFGDDSNENGTDGSSISSSFGTVTLDSQGPTGAFQDLAPNGSPVYEDVSPTGLNRPGAASGEVGILFSGIGDYLSGANLNRPSQSAASTDGGGPLDYSGIEDRGFQLWVYPNSSGSGSQQDVVMDSTQHGISISDATTPTWEMKFGSDTTDSGVAVNFDSWTHIMVSRPVRGRSTLYVDGIAVATDGGSYSDSNDNLIVGANSGEVGTAGTSNFFNGVLDELKLFVIGASDMGAQYGLFDFSSDNDFAIQNLSGVTGDVNNDGSLDSSDINDFSIGWENENLVGGILVGDLNSYAQGDLNFDGVTDLDDAFIMHAALQTANLGGLNFSALGQAVPEPNSLILVTMMISGLLINHRN